MKKLFLSIIVLSLLLGGCGERAEKVPPKEGLFPKAKAKYALYCEVPMGPNQTLFKFDLSFDEKEVYFNEHNSLRVFFPKNIYNTDIELSFHADGDEDSFYPDEVGGYDKKDRFWLLDKENGDFWAGIGELGFCIEKGCGWRLNKSENKFEYYCDKNKKSS
jgi:uncharacterized protein YceK